MIIIAINVNIPFNKCNKCTRYENTTWWLIHKRFSWSWKCFYSSSVGVWSHALIYKHVVSFPRNNNIRPSKMNNLSRVQRSSNRGTESLITIINFFFQRPWRRWRWWWWIQFRRWLWLVLERRSWRRWFLGLPQEKIKTIDEPISRFRSVDFDRLSRSWRPGIPHAAFPHHAIVKCHVRLDRDPSECDSTARLHATQNACVDSERSFLRFLPILPIEATICHFHFRF